MLSNFYLRWLNNNNKLKMIAPTWNDKCQLPGGSYSVSDMQCYIKYIIKKQKH